MAGQVPPEPPVSDTSWAGIYANRSWLAEHSLTPELCEHFKQELVVMAPTMRALGLDVGTLPPPPLKTGAFFELPPPHGFSSKAYAPPSAPKPIAVPHGGPGTVLAANIPPALEPLRPFIEDASKKSHVPANLIAAQIWQESRGVISAVSTNGGTGLTDTGLLQIDPATYQSVIVPLHPELAAKSLGDPENNIRAAAYYMEYLNEKFGGWPLALRAYNSGEHGVDVNDPNATPAGTGDPTYVEKVTRFWGVLDSGQGQLPP